MRTLNHFRTWAARSLAVPLLLAGISNALAAVLYVDVNSANPAPPYASWATAATNIQDAVDVAVAGDEILVTNGNYAAGNRALNGETNRVVIDKSLTVRSVNGPQLTIIDGGHSIRCVYLTNGASLSGFTLTNGFSELAGGGVWCTSSALVSNCVISGNSAGYGSSAGYGGGAYGGTLKECLLTGNQTQGYGCLWWDCWLNAGGGAYDSTLNNCTLIGNSADSGGGTSSCTLNNCTLAGNLGLSVGSYDYDGVGGGGASWCTLNNSTLIGNSALLDGGGVVGCTLNNCALIGNSSRFGGGAVGCTLNNCTLTGNSAADQSGGAHYSILNNCIAYFNTAPDRPNYSDGGQNILNYCCTTPMPTNGFGNITNAPLFVDLAVGNLRLQSNSPCINAGNNSYVSGTADLDGNPRIAGGTVDIGAYEFPFPTSSLSYAWLQQFGLSTDGSADFTDPDGDGLNNWQEWRCRTDPTYASSTLRLLAVSPAGTNVAVTWQSVAGVNYFLERATNLSASPAFTSLLTNLSGHAGTTSYLDTNALGSGPCFYRVGVSTQ